MALSVDHENVRGFFAFLQLKNHSPRTIAVYRWVLNDFFRSCPPQVCAP